jgi:hypothetical protein
MKITDFKKDFFYKGGRITHKDWPSNTTIGMHKGKFFYFFNGKIYKKQPVIFDMYYLLSENWEPVESIL